MTPMRRIDANGRLPIPREVREQIGLEPGSNVSIECGDEEIVIRSRVDRSTSAERLGGCIDEELRRRDAPEIDPTTLDRIWASDLL